jgi:23S rRNA (cytidine1920-2'-O)/16S rRNA (cytidine1409-2'-O)-methyltransferase
VMVMDKVNARYLSADALPFVPDFLTMDVAFISMTKVVPAVFSCMTSFFRGVILVKPQFEAGPAQVGKGGIVRDPKVHRAVLDRVGRFVMEHTDAALLGVADSGLPGTDGNREFVLHVERGGEKGLGLDTLTAAIDDVV